jgi:prepilin-type N-terminal cleavage/methylation domain-containing protein
MQKQKGFTIIELIVVIAIIAVLAAIVVVNVSQYISKSRDSRRLADMSQIQKALAMYYADNSFYPPGACASTGWSSGCTFSTFLSPYISNAPTDPINANPYAYYYAVGYKPTGPSTFVLTSSNQNYIIATRLENSSNAIFSGWGILNLNFLAGQ